MRIQYIVCGISNRTDVDDGWNETTNHMGAATTTFQINGCCNVSNEWKKRSTHVSFGIEYRWNCENYAEHSIPPILFCCNRIIRAIDHPFFIISFYCVSFSAIFHLSYLFAIIRWFPPMTSYFHGTGLLDGGDFLTIKIKLRSTERPNTSTHSDYRRFKCIFSHIRLTECITVIYILHVGRSVVRVWCGGINRLTWILHAAFQIEKYLISVLFV